MYFNAYDILTSTNNMITTGFLNIVYYLVITLTSPLRLAGDVQIDNNINNALLTVAVWIKNLDGFLPLTTVLYCVSLIILIEGFIFTYKMVMRILKFFPSIK